MKKILSLTIAIASVLGLFAQDQENDTLKIKWKGSRIWIFANPEFATKDSAKKENKSNKKEFVHWGGIDFGVSMLTTVDNKLNLSSEEDTLQINNFLDLNYSKSFYFSFNLFERNIALYKNYVTLVTGLGIEWNNYNFKNKITLSPDAEYISASNTMMAPDSIKFLKNKLKITYAKIPLLLELNTNSANSDKSFHIAGGIEIAYKLGSKTKQAYEINGHKVTSKRKDEYHLADVKISSVLRVGYGDYFTLFANYSMFQLFEKGKGPEIFPFTAGVAIPL